MAGACSVDGCERPHHSRGMCRTHYKQWRRANRIAPRDFATACTVDGCTDPPHGRGLCSRHYGQARRRQTITKPPPIVAVLREQITLCTWPGCDTEIYPALPDFWVHRVWPFHVIDHKARPA